jgi:NAD(P)-dependent dehydrogenase (short-subunit alcohol dehydrogenase family)
VRACSGVAGLCAVEEELKVDLGIAGKTVFFTGASKGMGRVGAQMLAKEGCKVAVAARRKEGVDKAVEAIRAAGGTAMGVSADILLRHRPHFRPL